MNQKNYQSIFHVNVNVDLLEKIVIQINGRRTINVDVSVKNIISVKEIMFGILVHAVVKIENI